jgi:hypothetical protein
VLRTSACLTIAAIAATGALAACGSVQLGSSAIVGGQRISASTLSGQVSNLEHAYQRGKAKIQLQFPLSQAPQQVLGWLVRFRVRDRVAARNHVYVSRGQSQQALASIAAEAGSGGTAALDNLAVANGLPPDLLPALGRYQAIETALVNRLDGGALPRSQTKLQALNADLSHRECEAAKSLNIKVNPQFGRMNYSQISIIPAATALSAPATPTPATTPAPKLSPPC